MLKIEKNIEIPSKRNSKFPFSKMEVGDSFYQPLEGRTAESVASSIVSSKYKYEEFEFTTRRVYVDGKIVGIRCWRIK